MERARCFMLTSSEKERVSLLRESLIPFIRSSSSGDGGDSVSDDDVVEITQLLFQTAQRYHDRISRLAVEEALVALVVSQKSLALSVFVNQLSSVVASLAPSYMNNHQEALIYLSWSCAVTHHAFPALSASQDTFKKLVDAQTTLLEAALMSSKKSIQDSALARISAMFHGLGTHNQLSATLDQHSAAVSALIPAAPAAPTAAKAKDKSGAATARQTRIQQQTAVLRAYADTLAAATPSSGAVLFFAQVLSYCSFVVAKFASLASSPSDAAKKSKNAHPHQVEKAQYAAARAVLDAHKKAAFELFVKTALITKSKPPAHLFSFSAPILRLVTHEDFASVFMPAIEKALLRNPEIVIQSIASLLRAVGIDLSKYAVALTKSLSGQLKSNDETVRNEAAALFSNLAKQCTDASTLDSVVTALFDVLNGSQGKLSAFEHRVGVLNGIRALHDAALLSAQKHSLAVAVLEKLAGYTVKETHEGTVTHTLSVLQTWAAHLTSFAPSTVALFTDGIKSAKAPVARSYLDALFTACLQSAAVSSATPFVDALLAVVKAAKAQTQASLAGNAVVAATVLLLIWAADVSVEPKILAAQFWEAVFDVKSKIILTDKLVASSPEKDLVAEVELTARILQLHEVKLSEADAGALSTAIVLLLGSTNWAVHKAAKDSLAKVLKAVNSKTTFTRLLGALKGQIAAFTSQRPLIDAIDALTTLPESATGADREAVVKGSLIVAHHPLISSPADLWSSIMVQSKVSPSAFVAPRVAEFVSLVVDEEGLHHKVAVFRSAAARATGTLVRMGENEVLASLTARVKAGTAKSLVQGITELEVAIWKTAEGVLFDKDLIKEIGEQYVAPRRTQEEEWDAKVKAEIEAKKAAASGSTVKRELTKKQQEALSRQLEHESTIRATVSEAYAQVHDALLIARIILESSAPSGVFPPVLAVHKYIPALVSCILPLLSSPLVSHLALESWLALTHPLSVSAPLPLPAGAPSDLPPPITGRLARFALPILYTTLRTLSPKVYVKLAPEWTQEPVAALTQRVVVRLLSTVENRPLPVSEFSVCLPALRAVLKDPRSTLQLCHQAFKIVSAHVELGFLQELPRLELLELLLDTITRHNRLEKEAASVLVKLASAMGSTCTEDESRVLLDSLLSPSTTVRGAAIEALSFVPLRKDNQHVLVLLWLVCHDGDESIATTAKTLWSSRSLQLSSPSLCDAFVDHILVEEEHVRAAASKALAGAVGLFVGDRSANPVASITAKLIELYGELLKVPPPERDLLGNIVNKQYVDRWWSRVGIAVTFSALSVHFGSAQIVAFFNFLVNAEALGDSAEGVRTKMLEAGQTALDIHGKAHLPVIIPIFEKYLDSPAPPTEKHDRIRESVVVLLGSLARHLDPSDKKVRPIIAKLMAALQTPSQQVQEAVSKCLPALVPAIKDDLQPYVAQMMHSLLEGERYAIRRGAAYGLAGLIKGRGIAALKDFNVMNDLQEAIQDKKNPRHREGALLAFEILCNTLGRLFEPYIIHILPHLLVCFGDGNKDVRAATEDTAKAIMTNLSGYGVKLILPSLLNALEDNAWRTKQGSVELLGAMAYCAPKQLSSCLPMIVPKLTDVLTDSHAKVQEAGEQALKVIGSVIRNPEIQAMSQKLLDALRDPNAKTQTALSALLDTTFVHFIDAPSLALIMPILQRALKERSTDTKKMAAQIIGNMSSLADHKDLHPYLPTLLPGLKQVLVDPIPEVRGIAARALGTLVKGMGEENFGDLIPWLLETIKSENSAVDRYGGAQGLSEVIAALGVSRLEELMPEIVSKAHGGNMSVREGYLSMFVFLPATFGEAFKPFIAGALPPILKGLADESEAVRDAALRAGQMIINFFAQTSVTILLPELEAGLFDENWRIRQSSVQLLGDLLYRISGLSGKKTTVSGDEDDTFGTEDAKLAILATLGEERRNRVLAGLYMARSDTSLIVRQASLHVWKTIVTNTPRTLREILTTLMTLLLGFLASKSYDQRTVAARTLGDLVRKLGDRVLPEIIPMIEHGLDSEDASQRQGVCVGLSEIMSTTSRDHILVYINSLLPAVRKALCDPLPEVRESAAQTFDHLFKVVGNSTIEEIVPDLLDRLQEPQTAAYALDGLRQIMGVKSHVVLPFLVPKLLTVPITTSHARALAALTSVAGSALNKHLTAILPALLNAACGVTETTAASTASGAAGGKHKGKQAQGASASEASGGAAVAGSTEEILDAAKSLVLGVDNDVGMRTLMTELLDALKAPEQPLRRLAAAQLLQALGEESRADWSPHLSSIIDALLRRFVDSDDKVVSAAWHALSAVTKSIDKEDMAQHIPNIRRTIKQMTEGGAAGGSVTLVRGFCIEKGIAPILPMFIHGLIYGSPETKEQAALGLGDLIRLTDAAALKIYVIQITGPLIRVVGDKFTWQVKSAILETLTLLISKVGIMLKPFLPQLQTTFIKTLHDPTKVVRVRASSALTLLISLHTRVDPLLVELHTNIKSVSGSIQESMLRALFGAVLQAGASMGDPIKKTLLETISPLLADNDDSVRFSAAQCIGAISKFLSNEELTQQLKSLLLSGGSSSDSDGAEWIARHGRALALAAVLRESPARVFELNFADAVVTEAVQQLSDDKVPISTAAVHSVAAILKHLSTTGATSIPPQLVDGLIRALKQGSSDVKLVALRVIKTMAKTPSSRATITVNARIIVPPILDAVKEKNIPVKLAAERALLYTMNLKSGEDFLLATAKQLDLETSRSLIDYSRRVLSRRLDDNEEEGGGSDREDDWNPFAGEN